jgi:hypothetical protein
VRPFPYLRVMSDADAEKTVSPTTKMAVALGATKRPGEVYGGTVRGAEKAKRRAVGKRQRTARKIHRQGRR